MLTIVRAASVALFLLANTALASAQDLFFKPVTIDSPILTELRVGASFQGVELNEDVLILPGQLPLEQLHKLSVEAMFGGIDLNVFNLYGKFMPSVGATISLTGEDSWIHAGVTWHAPIGNVVFFEATLGGTIHDGYLHNAPPGRRSFGCRGLIYAQGTVGVNLDEHWTASVNLEHGSHARLCGGDNPGYNSVGFKLGYKF